MNQPIHTHLSRRESQIMDIVYRLGEASVADVVGHMPDEPAYNSVRVTLSILERKGYVMASFGASGSEARGRARKYFRLTPDGAQALLRKQDAIQRMTEGVSVRQELEAI